MRGLQAARCTVNRQVTLYSVDINLCSRLDSGSVPVSQTVLCATLDNVIIVLALKRNRTLQHRIW